METIEDARAELERVKAVHKRQKRLLVEENQLLREELSSLLTHIGSLHARLEATDDSPMKVTTSDFCCQCDLPQQELRVHPASLVHTSAQPVSLMSPPSHPPITSVPPTVTDSPVTLAGEADRLLSMISKLRLETPKKLP